MANYIILDSTLMGLADAVREKTGKSESLTPLQMKDEILAMQYYGGNLGALPVLDTQFPKDIIDTFLTESTNATFTVKIAEHGNPASYSYQWYIDSNPVEGATNSTYTFLNITDTCSHTIYCTVTNKMGTITTRTAQLNMTKVALPVLNASYPQDSNITVINNEIKSATFKVQISTNGLPNEYQYQWYVNGAAVSGATSNTYIKNNLSETATYSIYCKVTNLAGTVQSRTATLKVSKYVSPILNSSYPKDITTIASASGTASFSIAIEEHGKPTDYTYQWYVNNKAVSGAINANYTMQTTAAQIGTYTVYCNITNKAGTISSRAATLNVLTYMPNDYFTYSTTSRTIIDDGNYNWRIKLTGSGTATFTKDAVVDVFLVGAGGAGGAGADGGGGGGGGGGYATTIKALTVKAGTYNIVVGSCTGGAGGNTTAFNITANGGSVGEPDFGKGGKGGSGGGAGGYNWESGGKGGANGSNGTTNHGSRSGGAGDGKTKYEFGASSGTLYCGGGGGGAGSNSSGGAGGSGGGGAGGAKWTVGTAGTANTGGGGGGGGHHDSSYVRGGNGGSGIVIIRNAR